MINKVTREQNMSIVFCISLYLRLTSIYCPVDAFYTDTVIDPLQTLYYNRGYQQQLPKKLLYLSKVDISAIPSPHFRIFWDGGRRCKYFLLTISVLVHCTSFMYLLTHCFSFRLSDPSATLQFRLDIIFLKYYKLEFIYFKR